MNNKPRAKEPIECQACHKTIEIGDIIVNHHITYFPEKIIPVHTSCHTRIHVGKTMYQHLKPDPRQVTRWYKKRNSNYVYHTYAFDHQFTTFMHSIDEGFLTPERIEEIQTLLAKKYWDDAYRYEMIRKKMNVTQTWSSYD